MNKEVKLTITIDGVDKEIKSVNDLKDAVKELGDKQKETADKTSFFGEKLKGIKTFFNGLSKDAKGLQNDFIGFAKGLGISEKAAKGLAVGLSALGLPILLASIAALIEFFKNFEQGMLFVEKATNVLNAAIGQLTSSFVALFSGDFKGFINGILGIGDAVKQAAEDTDILFESSRKLAEVQERNTEANAKLNKELKLAQKTIADGTASYEDRVKALEDIERVEKQLIENKKVEIALQLQELEASLRLENNQREQLKIKQQIAQVNAELINLEADLEIKSGQANKKIRELDIQRTKEAQEQAKKRLEIETKFQDDKVKLAQEIELLETTNDQEREQKRLQFDLQNQLEALNRSELNEEQKGQLRLQIVEKYNILEGQLNDKFRQAEEQKIKDAADKEEKVREDNRNKLNAILQKIEIDSIENAFRRAEAELKIEEDKQLEIARLAGASQDEITAIQKQFSDKRKALAQEEADFNEALAQAEKEFKLNLAADAFSAISALVGEQTAVGKAAAVAAATIDTYVAAQRAAASLPPPLSFVASGIAIAQGLANVRKILSVQTPGGRSVPAPSIEAPQATAFDPRQSLGQLNLTGTGTDIMAQQTPTVKAFVVSSDMTSQQEQDRKINNLSRL